MAPSWGWPSARSPRRSPPTRGRAPTYPQLIDEPFTLAGALGQRRIPATVVFDRRGHVVFTGEALDAGATAALGPALGETPCAP